MITYDTNPSLRWICHAQLDSILGYQAPIVQTIARYEQIDEHNKWYKNPWSPAGRLNKPPDGSVTRHSPTGNVNAVQKVIVSLKGEENGQKGSPSSRSESTENLP